MKILLYAPALQGHPQVYCRVIGDILLEAGHEIVAGGVELGGLPTAEAADQTLIIHTKEANCGIFLDLI